MEDTAITAGRPQDSTRQRAGILPTGGSRRESRGGRRERSSHYRLPNCSCSECKRRAPEEHDNDCHQRRRAQEAFVRWKHATDDDPRHEEEMFARWNWFKSEAVRHQMCIRPTHEVKMLIGTMRSFFDFVAALGIDMEEIVNEVMRQFEDDLNDESPQT